MRVNLSLFMTHRSTCLLLFALLWALSASAQNLFWREPLRITFTSGSTNNAELAAGAANGLLHLVCNDHEGYSPDHAYYRRSTDGGASFSAGRQLDVYPHGWASVPAVATSGQTVHVVYEQHMPSGPELKIAYRRSMDGGLHWERPIFLNHNAILPRVACQGDSVYVLYNIWQEPRHTRFRYSYDGGRTWSPEISLYPECVYPDLAACDGKVFVAYTYMEGGVIEIYLRRSLDGGQSWQPPQPVSANPDEHSQDPHLAAQPGGLLAVSWFDYEHSPMPWAGYIQCRVSENYGQSFNAIHVVSDTYYCSLNDIAVCGSQVHVAYTDERWGLSHTGIYYRLSPDAGAHWLAEQALCADSNWAQDPSIVAQPGLAYVAWEKNDGELYFTAGSNISTMSLAGQAIVEHNSYGFSVWPNPANGVVNLFYNLPGSVGPATLRIYDLAGRLVRFWPLDGLSPGQHSLRWENDNQSGNATSSGNYYIILWQGNNQIVKSLTLIK